MPATPKSGAPNDNEPVSRTITGRDFVVFLEADFGAYFDFWGAR